MDHARNWVKKHHFTTSLECNFQMATCLNTFRWHVRKQSNQITSQIISHTTHAQQVLHSVVTWSLLSRDQSRDIKLNPVPNTTMMSMSGMAN